MKRQVLCLLILLSSMLLAWRPAEVRFPEARVMPVLSLDTSDIGNLFWLKDTAGNKVFIVTANGLLFTSGYLTTSPQLDYSALKGSKPTAVRYGVWSGFSLPTYAADEEIPWHDVIPLRWDSICSPIYTATFYLDQAEDVGDTVRFVLLYNSKKSTAGVTTNTYKTETTKVAIVAGRSAKYSNYMVSFMLPCNDGTYPIKYGSEIAGILRRCASGLPLTISGEVVVTGQTLVYHCDKVYKNTP